MSKNDKNFDKETPLRLRDELAGDLKGLFAGSGQVPPERDRAILDAANLHFNQQQRRRQSRRVLRWATTGVAAAAVIVIGLVMVDPIQRVREISKPSVTTDAFHSVQVVREDIDRNGRVDILDAFTLARQIESAAMTDPKWDLDGDGEINQTDVDVVAQAAVRLNKGV